MQIRKFERLTNFVALWLPRDWPDAQDIDFHLPHPGVHRLFVVIHISYDLTCSLFCLSGPPDQRVSPVKKNYFEAFTITTATNVVW